MHRKPPAVRAFLLPCVLIVGLALAACGGDEPAKPLPPVDPIPLLVDGLQVAMIRTEDYAVRRALRELLPEALQDPAAWRRLEARSADGRFLRAIAPAEKRADQQVFLYRDPESGEPCVGFFRRPAPDAPAHVQEALARPTLHLVRPARVEILTADPEPPAPPAVSLAIEVVGGGTTVLTQVELAGLEAGDRKDDGHGAGGGKRRGDSKQGMAGGRRASEGWLLADVVGLVHEGPIERLRLHAGEGQEPAEVTGAVLAGEDGQVARLKQNRRGSLVVSVWRPGEGGKAQRILQVRDLARIEVVPR